MPFAAIVLILTALLYFLPGFTRPDIFFAVTVEPEFRRTPAAGRILLRFRAILWTFALAALGLQSAIGFSAAAMLMLLAGFGCALAVAHRQTLPHATPPGPVIEVNLAAPLETLPGGLPAALLPALSLGALAFWVSRHWVRLPESVPVHWGWRGPDRWIGRTAAGVYGYLAIHALLCLGLALGAWALLAWTRRIATAGPGAAAERTFRRRTVGLLLAAACFLAATSWIALLQPAFVTMWSAAWMVVLLVYVVIMFRSGQGGSRAIPPSGAPVGDRTPDACWKWGMIYVNRADPALFVEKRFGLGYTLNFGNRWCWVVVVLSLAPLALIKLLRK